MGLQGQGFVLCGGGEIWGDKMPFEREKALLVVMLRVACLSSSTEYFLAKQAVSLILKYSTMPQMLF